MNTNTLRQDIAQAQRCRTTGDIISTMILIEDILDTYSHEDIVNVPISMDDECIYGIYAKIIFLSAKAVGDIKYRQRKASKYLNLTFEVLNHQGFNEENMNHVYCHYKCLYYVVNPTNKKHGKDEKTTEENKEIKQLDKKDETENDTFSDLQVDENDSSFDTSSTDTSDNDNPTQSETDTTEEKEKLQEKENSKMTPLYYSEKAYQFCRVENCKYPCDSSTICSFYAWDLCFESRKLDDTKKGIKIFKESIDLCLKKREKENQLALKENRLSSNFEYKNIPDEYAYANLARALINIGEYKEAFEWIKKGYNDIKTYPHRGAYLSRTHAHLILQCLSSYTEEREELRNKNDDTESQNEANIVNENTHAHKKTEKGNNLNNNAHNKKETCDLIKMSKEKRINLAIDRFENSINLDQKMWHLWIGGDLWPYYEYAKALHKHCQNYRKAKEYYEIGLKIDQSLFWYVKDNWSRRLSNNNDSYSGHGGALFIPNDIWDIIVTYWYIPQNSELAKDYAMLLNDHFSKKNHEQRANRFAAISCFDESSRVYLVKGIDDGENAWYYVLVEQKKMLSFLNALNDEIIQNIIF